MNLDKIPEPILQDYMAYRITSAALAEILNCHPVTVRKNIKRPPRPSPPKNKSSIRRARALWRKTLAHLPAKEIQERAHVSLRTAYRIKAEQNA